MSKPRAPRAPDPKEVAAGQTGTNVSTAIANQIGGMVSQRGPDGSLSYNQTGDYSWSDPSTGQTYTIPRFEAVTQLDPVSAQTDAINKQAEQNLATLGRDQSGRLRGLLSEPVTLDNAETEARLIELGRRRLDPMMAERADATRTRLANQGIGMGSEAYDREMRRLSEQDNDAYTSLILGGRGQAIQERLTERNQPINEITALLSGSQVSQPNFINTPGLNAPTTDFAGITQQNYANQMAEYQQQMASRNALMGGLFGMGGNLGSAAIIASDERVKEGAERVGETDDGVPLYRYRYKGEMDDGRVHIGPMAQEVAKKKPGAVVPRGRLLAVNYEAL